MKREQHCFYKFFDWNEQQVTFLGLKQRMRLDNKLKTRGFHEAWTDLRCGTSDFTSSSTKDAQHFQKREASELPEFDANIHEHFSVWTSPQKAADRSHYSVREESVRRIWMETQRAAG